MRNRSGFSLPEMLVALLVLGVIGASMAQVLTVQSQFIQTQEGTSHARATARSGANVMLNELRMVDADSGVVAASATAVTVRVPFLMGIVCGTTGSVTTISALPIDSVVFAEAGVSGFAWRTGTGAYFYTNASVSLQSATSGECTAANISDVPGGTQIGISPAATGAPAGRPIFLFQRVRYEFKNSVAVPGQIGLWRAVLSRALDEELVAPLDSTARFRFFIDGTAAPQATVPSPLSNIRGLELQLVGLNERSGVVGNDAVPYTTAVFFKNR